MDHLYAFLIFIELFTTKTFSYIVPNKIDGPTSLNDRIAIIGAGSSGVHMAYLLKNKGFTNIEILEKSNRIGGKCYDIDYRGVVQKLGAAYTAPGYEEIISLGRKYLPDEFIDQPIRSVWLNNTNTSVLYNQYVFQYAMEFYKSNFSVAREKLTQAALKYVDLHQQMFGNYDGELMAKPNATVMHLIRGTFLDFLTRNELTGLLPFFYATQTMQGYGHVDKIAALYGFLFNTPVYVNGLLNYMLSTERAQNPGAFIFKKGVQRLWETMVTKENLTVKFESEVMSLYRELGKTDSSFLTIHDHRKNETYIKLYDFLIWSPDMKESLPKWLNVINEERELFSSTTKVYYTTAIVNSFGSRRSLNPISYWLYNMNGKIEDSVWAIRDSYATVNGYFGPLYQNNSFPNGDDFNKMTTVTSYQVGTTKSTDVELEDIIKDHFQGTGGSNITIEKLQRWEYFPRYSPHDIDNGILWKIVDIQGKYGMWYIGSSVCFESLKSVAQYNKFIVKNMKPIAAVPTVSGSEINVISCILLLCVVINIYFST